MYFDTMSEALWQWGLQLIKRNRFYVGASPSPPHPPPPPPPRLRNSICSLCWGHHREGNSPEQHVQALLITQRLLKALKLHSDPAKCWAWGSSSKSRKGWEEISAFVFGSPMCIRTSISEKDLGVQMHYSRTNRLGCMKDRIVEGAARIRKLWHAPCSIKQKADIVQRGVWPATFYGCFAVFWPKTFCNIEECYC